MLLPHRNPAQTHQSAVERCGRVHARWEHRDKVGVAHAEWGILFR
jgi:hypothetical protein